MKPKAISERGSRILKYRDEVRSSLSSAEPYNPHIPCIHIFVFTFAVFRAAVIHHFHFPTRGEVPSDNSHACFLKSFQVLKNEERAATEIFDDETGAARTELPLYDSGTCELAIFTCRLPGFAARSRKSIAHLLILPPMRSKRNWRPIVCVGKIKCHAPADIRHSINALFEFPHWLLEGWGYCPARREPGSALWARVRLWFGHRRRWE